MIVIIPFLFTISIVSTINGQSVDDYLRNRTKILEKEALRSLGGKLILNEQEILVNDILIKLKDEEVSNSFFKSENFNFSKPYFAYREYIETSKVYQLIKKMPKGGALHVHSLFVLDADYLLNLTYKDHLYACRKGNDLFLYFANSTQILKQSLRTTSCTSNWTLLSDLRNASDNVTHFDMQLKKQFMIFSRDDDYTKDIDRLWAKFIKIDAYTKALVTYRPVRERYIYDTLKKLYDDSVMYVELRSGFNILYELNGTEHEPSYMLKLYKDVTKKFIEDYPDFIGIKFIMTTRRGASVENLKRVINLVKDAKEEFPLMIAGIDLVGQEDKGKPLIEFLQQLLEVQDSIDFYFHAGETNWFGTSSDENLIDAILLRTKRIGHGYALAKHPVLMCMVLQQDIAVEVNVISNAVLGLVSDVRMHPLSTYLSLGLPVVLSSDDPGVWGAEPLSHDFYVTFVAIASKHADLKMLKQLSLNSIQYSSLENERKARFYKIFDRRWRMFLRDVIAEYSYLKS